MRDNLIFPAVAPTHTGLLGPATIVIELDQDIRSLHVEDILSKIEIGLESWCEGDEDVATAIVDSLEDTEYFKEVSPFAIRTSFRCSTMGSDPDELRQRAELALSLAEEKAIERELWSGPLSKAVPAESRFKHPYLLDKDTELIPGTYSGPAGLAVLEGAYADKSHGLLPMVYAPRSVATVMPVGFDRDNDRVVKSVLETPIIAGSGFNAVPGETGATLTDPTQALAVISGPTVVILGEVVITPDELSQAVMRQKNDIRYFAERQAVALTLGGAKFATVIDVTK